MTIRVLVADDEKAARARLSRLLAKMGDVEVVAECADGASTIAQVNATRPDVLFVDIEMPEGSGLDVATAVASRSGPLIVFVTAFDQYAVRAFEVHAADYLLKPFGEERLAMAWQRVRDQLRRGDATADRVLAAIREMRTGSPVRYRERLLVTNDGRTTVVSVADVEWLEAAANYVKLHLTGSPSQVVRDSMSAMESQLDPQRFARVHRSAIVNVDQIREIQPWFSGDQVIIMRSGARVKLSRTYRRAFDDRFSVRGT
jgi:two-component system LytT family response regulator